MTDTREKVARALARVEYDSDEDFEYACEGGMAPNPQWYRYADAAIAAHLQALGIGEGGENVVVERNLLLGVYRGLLVLRTMLKKEKLSTGQQITEEYLTELAKAMPELPGLAALRSVSPKVTP